VKFVLKNATAAAIVRPWTSNGRKIAGRTDDCELDGHQESQDIKQDLEERPFRSFEEPPGAWGENESVPGCNSESADEEILVSGEMGREIKRGG
jgi:hypothetical protein